MSKQDKKQASVSWCARDILVHKPDWSVAKCQRFLEEYEDMIQTRMIEEGWDAIQDAFRWREEEEERGVSIEHAGSAAAQPSAASVGSLAYRMGKTARNEGLRI